MTICFYGSVQLAAGVGVNCIWTNKFSDIYLRISLEKNSYSILQ